ncbi:CLUMA_CG017810, isoform A [Clunio marinus]|uniref:CLUMA_CG017810, isoform A n=1 Tax=Clunio marinus TaxID=568069 RepID=A0A1J1J005_9DIPT|nr:CLUMA_CG017810, isoform A [Clunio marinus]
MELCFGCKRCEGKKPQAVEPFFLLKGQLSVNILIMELSLLHFLACHKDSMGFLFPFVDTNILTST